MQEPDPIRLPDPMQALRRHIPHLHALLIGSTGEQAPIRTPCYARKYDGGIVKRLATFSQGWIPQAHVPVPPTTGEIPPIRTPPHPTDDPMMTAQLPGWCFRG